MLYGAVLCCSGVPGSRGILVFLPTLKARVGITSTAWVQTVESRGQVGPNILKLCHNCLYKLAGTMHRWICQKCNSDVCMEASSSRLGAACCCLLCITPSGEDGASPSSAPPSM